MKLLLDIAMASRHLSMEEVLAMLEPEEEYELDDPQEIILEGSDEEFSDLEEVENGKVTVHYVILM